MLLFNSLLVYSVGIKNPFNKPVSGSFAGEAAFKNITKAYLACAWWFTALVGTMRTYWALMVTGYISCTEWHFCTEQNVKHSDQVCASGLHIEKWIKGTLGITGYLYLESSNLEDNRAPRCRLILSWERSGSQGLDCSSIKKVRELGSERRETVRSLSIISIRKHLIVCFRTKGLSNKANGANAICIQ